MNRSLKRLSALLLPMAWACSDSPLEPTVREPVVAEARASVGASSQAELQQALDDAAADGDIKTIRVSSDIVLTSALTYGGATALTLNGQGHTITGPAGDDAFRADGGGDLRFQNVRFVGAGGHTSDFGIYVEVPGGATGTFRVELDHVDLEGFGLSGMWIDDQVNDSDASVAVDIRNSTVVDNGFQAAASAALADILAVLDFDGVRANEGGEGHLLVTILGSRFEANAADAFEGDEKGVGDAISDVRNSVFSNGGSQPQDIRNCDDYPELDPDNGLTNVPCDDYPDLEDGFDIDEDGPGSLHAVLVNVEASGNIDEGIDLDELGDGDATLVARNVVAVGNKDENIKVTESDPEVDELEGVDRPGTGDVVIELHNVTADGSDLGRGARFEEFGDGDLRGSINGSSFSDNAEDDGLRIDEEGEGSIDVVLRGIEAIGNDGQGLQVTENEGGDVILAIHGSEFTGNGNDAVEIEEEDAGAVDVSVNGSTLVGEGSREALQVSEDGDGGSVTIRGSTVTPAPDLDAGVTLDIRP